MDALTKFWDFVDNRFIVRRSMTLGTFILTVHVTLWILQFADHSTRPGADIAMIIGAVMLPLTPLMGYMFTRYDSGRTSS